MNEDRFLSAIRYFLYSSFMVIALLAAVTFLLLNPSWMNEAKKDSGKVKQNENISSKPTDIWTAPDSTTIPSTPDGDLVRYGRELVAHTSVYLGPQGKVMPISNGMNCQNCHLKAGKKPFGNNYASVASTYPKFRPRSGTIESVEKRVNDCIERSLNGKKLDSASKEMRAFVAYITWVGKDVSKGVVPKGAGIWNLALINRSADKEKGKEVYKINCARCHGENAQGVLADNELEWKYPPLFGDQSFNIGAGLYRLTRMAGYVKANMPNDGATFDKPVLSDEEAWDVAAFINSMPRPVKDISMDWPDVKTKPFDHPFGPYADDYSERQHKYGPFAEMAAKKK